MSNSIEDHLNLQDSVHASKAVIEIIERIFSILNERPDVGNALPTSPFRTMKHIKLASKVIESNKYESVVGVVRLKIYE